MIWTIVSVSLVLLYNKPIFRLIWLFLYSNKIKELEKVRDLKYSVVLETIIRILGVVPYFYLLRLYNIVLRFMPESTPPILEIIPIICSIINIVIVNRIIKKLNANSLT